MVSTGPTRSHTQEIQRLVSHFTPCSFSNVLTSNFKAPREFKNGITHCKCSKKWWWPMKEKSLVIKLLLEVDRYCIFCHYSNNLIVCQTYIQNVLFLSIYTALYACDGIEQGYSISEANHITCEGPQITICIITLYLGQYFQIYWLEMQFLLI